MDNIIFVVLACHLKEMLFSPLLLDFELNKYLIESAGYVAVPRSSESLENMMGACGQKLPYFSSFDGPSVEEQEDVDEGIDEFAHHVEKKRRLSLEQVRSLERNFEVENKLEPERKMQLAKELGLQPRQVAVWFQNRRARWKTKQLERDYETLKKAYDRLKADFEAVTLDTSALKAEVSRLKGISNDDVKPAEFVQGKCDTTSHPASPAQSERSDIVSSRNRTTPTIHVDPVAPEEAGAHLTMSSDSNSSEVMDADSPRTSHTSASRSTLSTSVVQPDEGLGVAQYPHFSPENFVGPNMPEICADQSLASQVKLEEIHSFNPDQTFLLLPNWWDWA